MKSLLVAAIAAVSGLLPGRSASGEVVAYPAPPGIAASKDYTVTAGGKPVAVYTVKTLHGESASCAYFDFAGSVAVDVRSIRPAVGATILPASFGIAAAIEDRHVRFTLNRPRNLTLEVQGIERVLHLFANPLEADRPKPGDAGVIYFGPGVHDATTLQVPDGGTLYLAGGAILRGVIPADEKPIEEKNWAGNKVYRPLVQINGVQRAKICGRGIIDLGGLPHHARTAVVISRSQNVSVEGIILLDAPAWGVAMFESTNVHVNNVKEICRRVNSDGIDICNSREVVVENCFLRNNDDEICVKTTAPAPAQTSQNILVTDCVVWNERARGLGITSETRRNISHATFRDCNVIHDFSDPSNNECAALAILVSDSGTMRDIRFENIRVNDVRQLIHCWIGRDMWGHDLQRGRIDGVLFKDIRVTGNDFPRSRLLGCDATHAVENVTFDHLVIQGKTVLSEQDGRISTNPFVRNVQFRGGK